MYDPPSFPSTFKYPNKTIRSEDNNNQQTFSRYYDPFNYSFYPQFNRNIQTNNNQKISQPNKNPILLTHHSYTHPLSTNSTQTNSSSQNQTLPYSNIVQSSQRRFQNPPLSYISTDPLYQMNQHSTYNHSIFTNCKHGTICSSSTSVYTNTTRYIHKNASFNTRTNETFRWFRPLLHPRRIFTTS